MILVIHIAIFSATFCFVTTFIFDLIAAATAFVTAIFIRTVATTITAEITNRMRCITYTSKLSLSTTTGFSIILRLLLFICICILLLQYINWAAATIICILLLRYINWAAATISITTNQQLGCCLPFWTQELTGTCGSERGTVANFNSTERIDCSRLS
jgi:hypothetical protein